MTTKFYLDQAGVQKVIYQGSKVQNIEREVMEKQLAQVKAAFLNEFGVNGNFILEFKRTKVGGKGASYINGTRPTYKISAGDTKTGALLKKHPGWLGRFSQNAKL